MAQQGQSSSAKGNPAHKRMSNTILKQNRQRSWGRGVKKRDERRAETDKAHKDNVALKEAGLPIAWEIACAARAARRAADPAVQARKKEHQRA